MRKIIPLFISLFFISCSHADHYDLLRTFFDGVDPPAKESTNSSSNFARDGNSQKQPKLLVIHDPYKEKDCGSCHDTGRSYVMNEDPPELCFSCHDSEPFERENVHLAIEMEGSCLTCHNPHQSQRPKLLKMPIIKACGGCHEDLAKGFRHFSEEKKKDSCVSCHTPHSSNEEYLLKIPSGNLCTSCHNPESPVIREMKELSESEGVRCADCHNPHNPLERNVDSGG